MASFTKILKVAKALEALNLAAEKARFVRLTDDELSFVAAQLKANAAVLAEAPAAGRDFCRNPTPAMVAELAAILGLPTPQPSARELAAAEAAWSYDFGPALEVSRSLRAACLEVMNERIGF